MEDDERQYLYSEEFYEGFFRLSVGIEDSEDNIEDIRQAFEKLFYIYQSRLGDSFQSTF